MIPRAVINERHRLMKACEVEVCPFCLLPMHHSDIKLHVIAGCKEAFRTRPPVQSSMPETVHKPDKEDREAEGRSVDDLIKMYEDS
jgi:hypothetical protein